MCFGNIYVTNHVILVIKLKKINISVFFLSQSYDLNVLKHILKTNSTLYEVVMFYNLIKIILLLHNLQPEFDRLGSERENNLALLNTPQKDKQKLVYD